MQGCGLYKEIICYCECICFDFSEKKANYCWKTTEKETTIKPLRFKGCCLNPVWNLVAERERLGGARKHVRVQRE